MEIPDIHACAKILLENEQLKKKLRKVKRQNAELQQELGAIQEKERLDAVLKQYVTTRNIEVQTDPQKPLSTVVHYQTKKIPQKPPESEKLNKLLCMHNNLMRRYEKELKINMQNVETITSLNLKVNELEQRLKEAQMNLQKLEKEKSCHKKSQTFSAKIQPRALNVSSSDEDLGGLFKELNQVRKERDKLRQEKKKLKEELKGLDHGFFEEVEDLKYALQQSALLNQKYEKSLRKLCCQFGVPYPHPDHS